MTALPNTRLIPLTQGKFAIVDEEDFDWLSKYKWYAQGCGEGHSHFYAARKQGKSSLILMHREIMCPGPFLVVDHINRDPLNNKRINLRVCTQAENMRNAKNNIKNTSGFRGVSWCPAANKWKARISIGKKDIYLGLFQLKEDAAEAYNIAAEKFFGEFRPT